MSDKIKDKIAKLLIRAEREESKEAREAYNAQAERLMIKYSIEKAMLEGHGDRQEHEPIVKRSMTFTGMYCRGHQRMAVYIAQAMPGVEVYVFTVQYKQGRVGVTMVGFESDVAQAEQLISSLLLQAITAMRKWWKNAPERHMVSVQESKHVRRSFFNAFGSGAAEKIKVVYSDTRDEVERETGKSTELALRNRDEEVHDWINANMRVGKVARSAKLNSLSWGAGSAAGRRADVGGKGIGNSKGIES